MSAHLFSESSLLKCTFLGLFLFGKQLFRHQTNHFIRKSSSSRGCKVPEMCWRSMSKGLPYANRHKGLLICSFYLKTVYFIVKTVGFYNFNSQWQPVWGSQTNPERQSFRAVLRYGVPYKWLMRWWLQLSSHRGRCHKYRRIATVCGGGLTVIQPLITSLNKSGQLTGV